MNKIVIIAIFTTLLFAPVSAQASDSWTKNEIIKQGIYGLIVWVDAKQTMQGIESGDYREANPFLGERPSAEEISSHLLTVFVGHALIANYLSTENRKMFQDVSLIIGITNITRNHAVGVRINF